MDNSKLTGNKNILYKISETEIPPSSTVSFKKSGSRPVSPCAHPAHPQKPSREHYQDDQAAMTKERSEVLSVLYSTLKRMSICCGAADHCEVQMPLSLIFFSVIWCQQTRPYMFLPEMVCTRVFKYHKQAEVGLLTRINGQTEPGPGFLQASPSTV